MKKLAFITAIAACSLLLTGCVTGRRTIELPITQVGGSTGAKGAIFLSAVEDARVFENKPKEASTPSVDGDVNSLTKEQLATMIGRQRNGYGKALGDIGLNPGDTVVKRTRLLLEEGLRRRGYTVTDNATDPDTMSVKIEQFWAWFTPGMWVISFDANVACKITITRGGTTKTITVRGYANNKGQVASNANWQLAYQKAFDDFLAKLDTELAQAGL
jgi:uncharacterized lipoprotein YajG